VSRTHLEAGLLLLGLALVVLEAPVLGPSLAMAIFFLGSLAISLVFLILTVRLISGAPARRAALQAETDRINEEAALIERETARRVGQRSK